MEGVCEVSKIWYNYIVNDMYFRQLQEFSQLQLIEILYSNSAAVLRMPPLLGPTAHILPYSQITEKIVGRLGCYGRILWWSFQRWLGNVKGVGLLDDQLICYWQVNSWRMLSSRNFMLLDRYLSSHIWHTNNRIKRLA